MGTTETTESLPEPLIYPAAEHLENPFPIFDQLREEAPVYKVPGREEWLVTKHETLTYVTSHPEIFSSSPPDVPWAPGWSETMIAQDPPEHTAVRKVAQRAFTPAKIKEYEPKVREIVDELIDGFIDKGEMEFCSAFANTLSLWVSCWLLGLPREDASWLERMLGPFEAQGIRYHPKQKQEIQEGNSAVIQEYLTAYVEERVKNPGDDVVSLLIKATEEAHGGEPNIPYLATEANVFLAGGLTTTGHMMASAMTLMLRNPETYEKVRSDYSLIPRMIEEVIRLETPAQYQPRYATQDTELEGVEIPRGACVLIVYAAANRDPERFECPHQFEAERQNVNKHVGFGHGPHFCLGAPLARMEGRVGFERLFDRLHDIRLAPGKNDFSHVQTMYFRAPAMLNLWFERADSDPFGWVAEGRKVLS